MEQEEKKTPKGQTEFRQKYRARFETRTRIDAQIQAYLKLIIGLINIPCAQTAGRNFVFSLRGCWEAAGSAQEHKRGRLTAGGDKRRRRRVWPLFFLIICASGCVCKFKRARWQGWKEKSHKNILRFKKKKRKKRQIL